MATAVPFVRRERPRRRDSDQSAFPDRGASRAGWWLYLIPGLVLLTAIVVVPLIWNVYLSFTEYRGIKPPEFIGLDNWHELATDSDFWASFRNSLFMIVAMVIVPTLLGLLIAALLFDLIGKKFGGRVASFLRATYYLPQILPVAIAGIVIGWILRPRTAPSTRSSRASASATWRTTGSAAPTPRCSSIMVVLVWVQLGYPVVIFMAALQRVDPELYEAAELDGASWFAALPLDHGARHPARDLRRHPHLHDRGAQGVRPDLRADARRPRARARSCRATTRTASSSRPSRSATARPSRRR